MFVVAAAVVAAAVAVVEVLAGVVGQVGSNTGLGLASLMSVQHFLPVEK